MRRAWAGAVLAAAAERSLDAQYYLWHNDTTGRLLISALLRAADHGVRVRLLLDDVGSAPNDRNLLVLDEHPNVEVRLEAAEALAALREFDRRQQAQPYVQLLRDSPRRGTLGAQLHASHPQGASTRREPAP